MKKLFIASINSKKKVHLQPKKKRGRFCSLLLMYQYYFCSTRDISICICNDNIL